MENLTDLINQEFEKAGYRSDDGILWKHQNYMDFWFVVTKEGDYELSPLQEAVYSNLEGVRNQEPEMEKNTSLLILNLVDEAGKNKQRIIEDENDVYVFKKYVIQYTWKEWEDIREIIEGEGVPFEELLMRADLFESMKADHNGSLSLLYTIAHKLPFVTMRVTKKEYEISNEVKVPEDMQELLAWVDSVRPPESKTVKEEEINAIKDTIASIITEENSGNHEDRANTPA